MMRGFSVVLLGFSCALQLGLVGAVHEQASVGASSPTEIDSTTAMSDDIGKITWEKFETILSNNGMLEKMKATPEGEEALAIWEALFADEDVKDAIGKTKLFEAFEKLSTNQATPQEYLSDAAFQQLDHVMTDVLEKTPGKLEALRVGSVRKSGTNTSEKKKSTEDAQQVTGEEKSQQQVTSAATDAEILSEQVTGGDTIQKVDQKSIPKQKKVTLVGFTNDLEKTLGTPRGIFNGDYYEDIGSYSGSRRCVDGKPTFWKSDRGHNFVIYWCPTIQTWGVVDKQSYDHFAKKIAEKAEQISCKAHVWFQRGELAAGLSASRVKVGGTCEGCKESRWAPYESQNPDDEWVKEAKVEKTEDIELSGYEAQKARDLTCPSTE